MNKINNNDSIYEKKFKENFTIITNEILRDNNISYKSIGILMRLLSNNKGWKTVIEQLINDKGEKRTAIMSGFDELENNGYLLRLQYINKKTKKIIGGFIAYTQDRFVFDFEKNFKEIDNENLYLRPSSTIGKNIYGNIVDKSKMELIREKYKEINKPILDNPILDNPFTGNLITGGTITGKHNVRNTINKKTIKRNSFLKKKKQIEICLNQFSNVVGDDNIDKDIKVDNKKFKYKEENLDNIKKPKIVLEHSRWTKSILTNWNTQSNLTTHKLDPSTKINQNLIKNFELSKKMIDKEIDISFKQSGLTIEEFKNNGFNTDIVNPTNKDYAMIINKAINIYNKVIEELPTNIKKASCVKVDIANFIKFNSFNQNKLVDSKMEIHKILKNDSWLQLCLEALYDNENLEQQVEYILDIVNPTKIPTKTSPYFTIFCDKYKNLLENYCVRSNTELNTTELKTCNIAALRFEDLLLDIDEGGFQKRSEDTRLISILFEQHFQKSVNNSDFKHFYLINKNFWINDALHLLKDLNYIV